jgi:CTP-dependent riboflavin kinase
MIPRISIQKCIYVSQLAIVFDTSYVNGHGKGSFFIAAFNFTKSTQILNFSFFLGTTTIDDNHVASSASCMKHVVNNLSMSYFIVVA